MNIHMHMFFVVLKVYRLNVIIQVLFTLHGRFLWTNKSTIRVGKTGCYICYMGCIYLSFTWLYTLSDTIVPDVDMMIGIVVTMLMFHRCASSNVNFPYFSTFLMWVDWILFVDDKVWKVCHSSYLIDYYYMKSVVLYMLVTFPGIYLQYGIWYWCRPYFRAPPNTRFSQCCRAYYLLL